MIPKKAAVKSCALTIICLTSFSAFAEPMHFEVNRDGGNHCCIWIQATGDITQDTAASYETFLKANPTEFVPNLVRLNSPGGSLFGGILLGKKFREFKNSSEVGSSSGKKIGNETLYS